MVDFEFREHYTIDDLRRIVAILRHPGGCPWDAEQTHESLRRCLMEECCEVLEAIDRRDDALLCEELGDVLLQVVFHTSLAEDTGRFDLDAVADWDADKLNQLITDCGLEEITFRDGETINNMQDFCRILCYFAIHGLGGEIALTSQEVVEEIEKHFQVSYSPGGTCAQGAAAMGELGIPVLSETEFEAMLS